jgi:tetratricopeptide (TPR) repeat protein
LERRSWLACSVIVLAALAAYYNSLSCPFIFDDLLSITDNPTIRHLGSSWASTPYISPVTSRPLINFSLAVNYALGGLDVRGYHALNLAFHICSALALFGIVRRTFGSLQNSECGRGVPTPQSSQMRGGDTPPTTEHFRKAATPLAFTIALLWAVHPLQTESVTCVVQRTESLMGLFYLLTLYCFLRSVENRSQVSGVRYQVSEDQKSDAQLPVLNPQRSVPNSQLSTLSSQLSIPALQSFSSSVLWWRLASIFCCLAGMATKEVMVSAPLMVLLYDRTFVAGSFQAAWQQRRKYYAGLASTWLLLGYLVIAAGGERGAAAGFGHGVSPWTYALTQCQAIIHYLKLSLWPHPLVLDYGTAVVRHLTDVLPQALFLLFLVMATIFSLWRCPALGFLGAWFFAILAPSSSFVPLITQTVAEHRMYLPLAAVVVLGVLGLYVLIGRRAIYAGLGLAVLFTGLTLRRNEKYRSDLMIWADTVAKCPGNERAHNNLGNDLLSLPGWLPEAIAQFQTALQIDPDYAEAHYNLGLALKKAGRIPEAIAQYDDALRINPDYAEAHSNLGNALLNLPGRLPEALLHFQAALRVKPDYADAHYNLGVALKMSGRIPEAIAQYETVLRINPDYAEARSNLGNIFFNLPGRLPEAISQYEAALRTKPNYADAHNNLGLAFAKQGNLPEAREQIEAALRIQPSRITTYRDLGVILDRQGDFGEATENYRQALQLAPNFVEARFKLAVDLQRTGQLDEAIDQYREVVLETPDNAMAQCSLGTALAQQGQVAEALAQFEKTVRMAPEYAEAHYDLGTALAQSGRFAEALGEYKITVQLKPDFAPAHYNFGNTLAQLGRRPEAIEQYELALKLNPDFTAAKETLELLEHPPSPRSTNPSTSSGP